LSDQRKWQSIWDAVSAERRRSVLWVSQFLQRNKISLFYWICVDSRVRWI
jgi:hypothetical protein